MGTLSLLCSLLLAGYSSRQITRFWELRREGLGVMWGVSNNLSMILDSYVSFDDMRSLAIKRYCIVAVSLIFHRYKQSGFLISEIIFRGHLTKAEGFEIETLQINAESIWRWVVVALQELVSEKKIPLTIADNLFQLLFKARSAAGMIHAYMLSKHIFKI